MKNSEIMAMPAGKEIDILVIQSVLKWKHVYTGGTTHVYINPKYGAAINFSPSTDMAAALELTDEFESYSLNKYSGGKSWRCQLIVGVERDGIATAPTAPLAICRAALIAVIGEE